MSSPYEAINGNQPSEHLDSESKSSVNIATEILEAQRLVTRRLQQRREKEKNQREKIYESSKDIISSGHPAINNSKTTNTTTTTTYNTRLENNYSPLAFRKSTIIVNHSNSNSNSNSSSEE
jgi:hypothetical protein